MAMHLARIIPPARSNFHLAAIEARQKKILHEVGMLSLEIKASSLKRPWRMSATEMRCGQSWIRSLQHPMLESYTLRCPQASAMIVRERGAEAPANQVLDAANFYRAVLAARAWPLQTTILVIDHQAGAMSLRQGAWGTAPIYLMESAHTLRGHWDPLEFYPYLDCLDLGRASRFLHSFDMPYSRRTLFFELQMLTALSCALWNGNTGLRISYPNPASVAGVRTLCADARPAEAALKILEGAVKRWIHADIQYGSELSGGLDSSLVSILCRQYQPGLSTFGIHLDAPGQQQRRQSLIERFGFHDASVDLNAHLPLAADSPRWHAATMVPWGEIYDEGVNAMLATAARQGVQAMFTGFGGDELCPLYAFEDPAPPELAVLEPASATPSAPDFLTRRAMRAMRSTLSDAAPRAMIDASSLESAAFGSAIYLRHGIWPIHPLCTPELNRFCGALPWSWRVGRTIERAMLRQLDCPSEVVESRTVDSFQSSLSSGLRHSAGQQLCELFDQPLLAELDLVDPRQLRNRFLDWCENGTDDEALPFYSAASLEMSLRSIGARA
ncbi:asparagine synthase [Nitrosospira lacus]|nr:asparagine synthase [Nitrosospira lacus]